MKTTRMRALGRLPVLLLWLAGGPLWAGTEGTSSTFYGLNAGASGTSSSGANTYVGWGTGQSATGMNNTFMGFASGLNGTGQDNTLLGAYAGTNQTSGGNNTFVGMSAGNGTTSGSSNTFVGKLAAYFNNTGFNDTYLGVQAGYHNTSGQYNTGVGLIAGFSNTTGSFNSYLGAQSGANNVSGSLNVFVGNAAGYSETGSNKLYIDNCLNNAPCTSPFIYGEFDNHLLKVNGVLNVRADGAPKSQMHFSQSDTDTGGFLTSVLDNNFFVSSGARYDGSAGGWTQRSPDTNAVIAGSGGVGYRIFTHAGTAVGSTFTPTVRLHIDYSGQFGINTAPVAGHEIHASSGAHLTAGGVWTDASSREYKEHIRPLAREEALQALANLQPVRYNYKVDPQEEHVGFIAEDVPELVATKDRKSLAPMDIVAVLTKVVTDQRQQLERQEQALEAVKSELRELRGSINGWGMNDDLRLH